MSPSRPFCLRRRSRLRPLHHIHLFSIHHYGMPSLASGVWRHPKHAVKHTKISQVGKSVRRQRAADTLSRLSPKQHFVFREDSSDNADNALLDDAVVSCRRCGSLTYRFSSQRDPRTVRTFRGSRNGRAWRDAGKSHNRLSDAIGNAALHNQNLRQPLLRPDSSVAVQRVIATSV